MPGLEHKKTRPGLIIQGGSFCRRNALAVFFVFQARNLISVNFVRAIGQAQSTLMGISFSQNEVLTDTATTVHLQTTINDTR